MVTSQGRKMMRRVHLSIVLVAKRGQERKESDQVAKEALQEPSQRILGRLEATTRWDFRYLHVHVHVNDTIDVHVK